MSPGSRERRRAAEPAERRAAARPGPAVLDAALLFGLGALALLGFRNTYAGWGWLAAGGAGLAAGIAAAWLGVRLRQPVIGTAAATLILFAAVGVAVTAPGSIASPHAYTALVGTVVHGWRQLLTSLPPVPAGDPLVALPFALGLACGALGYALARALPTRKSLGAGATAVAVAPVAVPVAALATVIALGTRVPGAELVDGVAFTVCGLSWAVLRRARTRPIAATGARGPRVATAAGVVAVAGCFAIVTGGLSPAAGNRTVLRDHVTPPFDIGQYPSPLVGFRKFTKDANLLYDQTLFTVTGLPSGAAVRIASLDDYDGLVWGATNDAADGSFRRVGQQFGAPVTATTTVRVTISAGYADAPDLNAWLPDAGTVTGVVFSGPRSDQLAAGLRFNLDSSSGIETGRLRAGDTYAMRVLTTTPALPADVQPAGRPELTEGAEPLIGSHVATWTHGAQGLGPQLAAVAAYLHTAGAYSDGGHGERQYLPGHSLGRLASFFNGPQPVGDDEQYAAAYALVANYLGIPARVVFGARPEADGAVRGRDIHAWVEVHVADAGWVAIPETTFMPPTSQAPKQQPLTDAQPVNQAVVPPPGAARRPSTLTDQGSSPTPPHNSSSSPCHLLCRILHVAELVLPWAAPPVLAVGLVAGAILGTKRQRRRRRRHARRAANRFAGGWRELIDRARDLGVVVPAGLTRSAEADLLAGRDVDPRPYTRGFEADPPSHRIPPPRAGSAGDNSHPTVRMARASWPASLPRPEGSMFEPAAAAGVTVLAAPRGAASGDTVNDAATRLSREIRRLADDADRAVFGPDDPSEVAVAAYWKRVDGVRRDLARGARRRRIAVALSIRSLRRRPARRPAGRTAPVAALSEEVAT